MPRFNANLTMLYNEVDFLERFAAAAGDGFKGVEYLFPYPYEKNVLVEHLQAHNLNQVLHNLPAGDWAGGDRRSNALRRITHAAATAAVRDREAEIRKLNILGLLAAFMVGGYAYHTVTNITDSDVAAFHKLDQELRGFRAFPGDIVAVSPDGSDPERICNVGVASEHVDNVEIDDVYMNSFGRVLPRYKEVWAMLSGLFGDTAPAVVDRVAFSGQLRALYGDVVPGNISRACECAMAKRMIQRDRICTVHGSLVERGSELVQAIKFKRHSNFVNPEMFEACGLDRAKVAEQNGTQSCSVANLPWDAVLRSRLGLIETDSGVEDEAIDLSAAY